MISVIIPLYNKEPIIERTLKSVLTQDYDDFEVIVVNDGSTDKSADIVRSINDKRIRLIEQNNGGPSKARNTGVKNAKGEWIVFLDADDEFLPGSLYRFASMQKSHPDIEFFNCSFIVKSNTKKIISEYHDGIVEKPCKEYFYKNMLPRTGSMMVSKRIMLLCPFDERLRRFEDFEILLRMYRKCKVYHCKQPSMIQNTDYAAASIGRPNILEDFMGHLSFSHASFWEKMCIYELYLGEREFYKIDCKRLYPIWRYRYDLLIIHKVLNSFK